MEELRAFVLPGTPHLLGWRWAPERWNTSGQEWHEGSRLALWTPCLPSGPAYELDDIRGHLDCVHSATSTS